MSAKLGRLQSRDAVQQALDEFVRVGRTRMDLIANAFGHARCFRYGQDGRYRERC